MPDLEKLQAAFKEVDEDVREGIGKVGFTERGTDEEPALFWGPPFEQEENRASDDIIAVPWRFTCRHDGDYGQIEADEPGIFEGLFPTGRDVTIRGVTFVDLRGREPELYRYVDWGDVLTQLGCTVSQRVILDEEAYVTGLGVINDPAES